MLLSDATLRTLLLLSIRFLKEKGLAVGRLRGLTSLWCPETESNCRQEDFQGPPPYIYSGCSILVPLTEKAIMIIGLVLIVMAVAVFVVMVMNTMILAVFAAFVACFSLYSLLRFSSHRKSVRQHCLESFLVDCCQRYQSPCPYRQRSCP